MHQRRRSRPGDARNACSSGRTNLASLLPILQALNSCWTIKDTSNERWTPTDLADEITAQLMPQPVLDMCQFFLADGVRRSETRQRIVRRVRGNFGQVWLDNISSSTGERRGVASRTYLKCGNISLRDADPTTNQTTNQTT